MAESSDVQALEKISTEVDESQIKVILSTQCIKAQTFLVDKLRKQSDRHKEICSFISSANVKLGAEIKQAEQEIISLNIAQETIKLANIELKKEWLLAQENKQDLIDRIKTGEKKYEEMWLEAKNRFESLPYVQQMLENIDKTKEQESNIELLEKEAETLFVKIEKKRQVCMDLDRKRIIELAEFIVNEMPNNIKLLNERSAAIDEITEEINGLMKDQVENTSNHALKTLSIDQKLSEPNDESKNIIRVDDNDDSDDSLMMPKLQLANIELDDISLKLKQIKQDAIINDPSKIIGSIVYDTEKNGNKYDKEKSDEYIPSCFNNTNIFEDNKVQNFSNRKLINILEDIKVDKNDAYNIVSKVNPQKLQTVTTISADENVIPGTSKQYKAKSNEPMESDEIEEIDLTGSNNIIIPPTQFLDTSMNSQEGPMKKNVSFDLPPSQSLKVTNEASDKAEEGNETINSQLDVSAASDESFVKIKDMIIKKHNLDSSPQFVYARNDLKQMGNDDKIISSKFFNPKNQQNSQSDNIVEEMEEEKQINTEDNNIQVENQSSIFKIEEKLTEEGSMVHMDIDEMIISSPKMKTQVQTIEKPVAGLLFSHGTQAIPDSLNVSMSTTGYEDGDTDFPHCIIDSSLLLSPKADIEMPMSCENPEILSQEVPNFLTGFRKTGLSFFGQMNLSEPKPDSSAQDQGNSFNFNFGGNEDKKNRGGLFSMFH